MPVRPVFTSLRPTFRTSTLRTPLLGLLAFSLAACGGDQTQESPTTEAQPDAGSAAAPEIAAGPALGKYGCVESISRMRNGSFEFESEGRGYVTLREGGRYTDPFDVKGNYHYEEAGRETRFTGGALDGAVATPLEGEGPRLRVVIPTESGERRWSCSLT